MRGVNVLGNNKMPMKELAAELEKLGLTNVQTYIQSGNVVFQSPKKKASKLAIDIQAGIKSKFGFEPHVIVLDKAKFVSLAAANPFPKAENEMGGKALHLFFLSSSPRKVDENGLNAIKRPSECWQIVDSVLYLHTPEGFHVSKIARKAEKILGVAATARNWRTVSQIMDMI